jgi:D-tyrosyl-tRNA(Tyr) deacylase|tara:strand:- start:484 stop:924 length:441 start_codon:yes stop_codon:yes gene_type:complete
LKLLAQRVLSSSVLVDNKEVSSIGKGALVLIGFEKEDTPQTCNSLIQKFLNYKMFSENEGRMEKTILDINGDILLVPQITLVLETKVGNKPSFSEAANAQKAEELFNFIASEIKTVNINKLNLGVFGANMRVNLVNDGPVTFYFSN